jgi:hypothetical protein
MRQPSNRRPSRRSLQIRAKWQGHLSTQQASGLGQSVWCRQHDIDPKYFSLWKSKLAKSAALVTAPFGDSNSTEVALVPVTIRAPVASRRAKPVTQLMRLAAGAATALSPRVTLPNGIDLAFQLPSGQGLAALLAELAHLPC